MYTSGKLTGISSVALVPLSSLSKSTILAFGARRY